jgi:hypothetical protein
MSKSDKSKTPVEDTDEELTDEEVVVGKYFGFRHNSLAVFAFSFFFYFYVFIKIHIKRTWSCESSRMRPEKGGMKRQQRCQKKLSLPSLGLKTKVGTV